MKKTGFEAIVRALNDAQVPFITVGGVAVVHHGYGRATQDVDLVIRMEEQIILRAFHALGVIGYRPVVPITGDQFAKPAMREQWGREKGMKVLRFWSDQHPQTPLDIFIFEPFEFENELKKSDLRESGPGLQARIVSLDTLLAMKRSAGRPQDIADIDELNLLHGRSSSYDREK